MLKLDILNFFEEIKTYSAVPLNVLDTIMLKIMQQTAHTKNRGLLLIWVYAGMIVHITWVNS